MNGNNRKNTTTFDVFEDLLKRLIIKGMLGFGILLGMSLLLSFLSVAVYAAQVEHAMSFTDYLYSYDHTLLKFFLFVAAGLSVVLNVGVFSASVILSIYRKAWRSLFMLCLSVGGLLFLLFVPVPQSKTLYAAQVKIKPEYVEKGFVFWDNKTEVTTDYYPTYQEAKNEVRQSMLNEGVVTLKEVSKVQKVKQPLLHFRLPKNPNPRATEQEESFN
jgi:hypothetical protein